MQTGCSIQLRFPFPCRLISLLIQNGITNRLIEFEETVRWECFMNSYGQKSAKPSILVKHVITSLKTVNYSLLYFANFAQHIYSVIPVQALRPILLKAYIFLLSFILTLVIASQIHRFLCGINQAFVRKDCDRKMNVSR